LLGTEQIYKNFLVNVCTMDIPNFIYKRNSIPLFMYKIFS